MSVLRANSVISVFGGENERKKEKKRNGLAGIRTWVARTAVEDATLYAMKAYLLEAG